MTTSGKADGGPQERFEYDVSPIPLLERVQTEGRPWVELAAEYGVTNPDPPWKITLDVTCDLLAGESCVKAHEDVTPGSCALPVLERRAEEDDLASTIYEDVPFPERQLLALAHSMIRHGLITEDELAKRMARVSEKLNSA